ncbi:MAG: flagellar biosynthesis anti-sigma factor FlgM [Oscillospiraceae bacterium]|nr:flagellar biosynthesis anti-sigma factor FlgM [Oscillospiraceae bacterium]
MKISSYLYAGAVKSYGGGGVKQKNNNMFEFSQVLDTVEISSDGKSRLDNDTDIRMDRVTLIREKINSGSYKTDSFRAAGNILSCMGY